MSNNEVGFSLSIRKSSNFVFKRIMVFSVLLLCALFSIYTFMVNPDFLHSALSFKTIEDDEAVSELVYLSKEISENKSSLKNDKDYENKTKGIYLDINSDVKDNLKLSLLNDRVSIETKIQGELSKNSDKANVEVKMTYDGLVNKSVIFKEVVELPQDLLNFGDLMKSIDYDEILKKLSSEDVLSDHKDLMGSSKRIILYKNSEPIKLKESDLDLDRTVITGVFQDSCRI